MIKLHAQIILVNKLEFSIPESVAVIVEFYTLVSYVPPKYDKIKFGEQLYKKLKRLVK